VNARALGFVVVPLAAAAAFAQEAPKPAPPATPPAPAPETLTVAGFVGTDAIRKSDGLVVHFYRVNYVDAKLLAEELVRWKSSKALIVPVGTTFVAAPNRGNMAASAPVQTTLRIEETEENWPNLRHVLDLIDVPQPQVYIEAKIVELSYTDELHYGTEAHFKRSLADTFFQGTDVKFPNRVDAVNQFTTSFHEGFKYATFDYVIDLANAGARTTVISKPAVFASQGETATIRVGDNEPVVEQNLQGTSILATTRFRDTGLTLEVQPLLIGRDAIRARINAVASRVSDFRTTATSANLQVVNPVFSERKADTVVTVPDGETLPIGGLDQDFSRDQRTGIPLLMDIPLLGFAFGSTTKRKEHSEIVFFLTFRILSPQEARVVVPPAADQNSDK
jgi:type II secretory pathway component GspD/PulD (secretin)